MMEEAGIPLSRWADGVLEAKENVEQSDTLKAVFFWGHAPNSQTRGPDLKKAFEKLDMLVVVDPHPTVSAVLHDRTDGVYLLPAATQYETTGSVTASNRSLQWREKVFGPFFEAKADHEIMYLLAKKLGFEKEMFKNIKVEKNEPVRRGHHPRVQQGHVDDRLHRPEPRAAQAAHGQPAHLRQGDAEGQRRPVRRRLLRLAVALLGHAPTIEASRHAQPLRHLQARRRRRPQLPRQLGADGQGAGQRQVVEERSVADSLLAVDSYPVGRRDQGRPPAGVDGHAAEDGMGQGPHARGARRHQQDRRRQARERDVDRRHVGRHPARGDQARHRAVRQRQGALRRLELPRRRAAASRAALHRAPRPAAEVCDPHRIASSTACRCCSRRSRSQGRLQGVSDRPHLGPSGRVRGRRRGAALQPVARRAAAEHVRRDQPRRRQQSRHQGRPAGVGGGPREGQGQGHGDGDGAGRQGRRLHAVPLRRPLPGQGPADRNILQAPTPSCSASRPTRPRPTGTTSSPRCRKPRPRSARFGGPEPWRA